MVIYRIFLGGLRVIGIINFILYFLFLSDIFYFSDRQVFVEKYLIDMWFLDE